MVTKRHKSWRQVFCVDDERGRCAAAKEILEELNVTVRCFVHPSACLAQLRSRPCDLLIADLNMSEINGMQFLKQVRMLAPWIPVLIVTEYADVPTAVEAMKWGVEDLILKPFARDSFVQKVNLLLERSCTTLLDCFGTLTMTEVKMLRMIINGWCNSDIASAINRSVRTVEWHRYRLMRKLGVHNLVDLVKVAIVVALVDPSVRLGIRNPLRTTGCLSGGPETR